MMRLETCHTAHGDISRPASNFFFCQWQRCIPTLINSTNRPDSIEINARASKKFLAIVSEIVPCHFLTDACAEKLHTYYYKYVGI